ncbi:MAG: response regulator transcription factor [Planctomycetota bacterium]|nr:response regulator transcription factor [Planctomycetota bacterium]
MFGTNDAHTGSNGHGTANGSSAPTKVRVVVADDHAMVRETLAAWLGSHEDIDVCAEAEDSQQVVAEVSRTQPDVLLLDIQMPGADAFATAAEVRRICPATRIVFLTAYQSDTLIDRAREIGAVGYLLKGQNVKTIREGILAAASGATVLSPEIQSRLLDRTNGVAPREPGRLSPRELEVLRLLAVGRSKKEVAKELHVSVKTVDNHTTNIMTKLDIHDRVQLARYAIREGLVSA